MPVTDSFKPQRQQDLNKKVRANKPGQEAQLLKDVQSHLEQQGSAVYRQSPDGVTDVALTGEKCVVFLIKGKFKVGGRDDYKQGEAHVVENEEMVQLDKGAVVVIIDVA